jgi:protein-disulfide isomerase
MDQSKDLSKRQMRRQEMRRREVRSRLTGVGLTTVGALFVAFFLIYPNVRPITDVVAAAPRDYPQAERTALGDPNAPVRIDVFEDFQCPACRTYSEEIETRIIEDLVSTGKVYYVFHNYTFLDGGGAGNGGESDQAANAVMCAAEQGRFWEMHGTIFANWNGENQGAFSDRRLRAMAEKAGLDLEAFDACFDANTYQDEIQADFDAGTGLGVTGTPSVFVNQKIVNPGFVPSYEEIESAVEAAIAGN